MTQNELLHEWSGKSAEDLAAARPARASQAAADSRAQRVRSWNPLEHPICLSMPRRLGPLSAWTEHIPFAMVLVDLARPRTLVELGTYTGESYCAFCQAVAELRLDTRCYAIDTWEGDPHTGGYGPDVMEELRKHHDSLYGSFSRLIQSSFDGALAHFDDGSIDLLHLDGYHTYASIKHDFESWLPKLSRSGVILIHDTNVRERDFGVRQLWEEVRTRYAAWEFYFGHGLGMLVVGEEMPNRLRRFLEAKEAMPARINSFFHGLGRQLSLKVDMARKEAAWLIHLQERDAACAQATTACAQALAQAEEIRDQLGRQLAAERECVGLLRDQLGQASADRQEKEGQLGDLTRRVAAGDQAANALREQLRGKDRTIQELFDITGQKERLMREINTSAAWSLAQGIRGLRSALAPEGSRRWRLWRWIRKVVSGR